jgi:hypothetical protein
VVENALAIPVNLALGVALTEFISETSMPTIAHHHDFYWERRRLHRNCVGEYLDQAFPPRLPSARQVMINSVAAEQLSRRKGLNSVLPSVRAWTWLVLAKPAGLGLGRRAASDPAASASAYSHSGGSLLGFLLRHGLGMACALGLSVGR